MKKVDVRFGDVVVQVKPEQVDDIRAKLLARQRRINAFLAHDNTIERLGNPGNQLAGWVPSSRRERPAFVNRSKYNVTPAH